MGQKEYVELRLKIPKELKETLLSLGEVNNLSANRIGTMLVNQILQKKPNLLDAMSEAICLKDLEKRLMPVYLDVLDSYSLMDSTLTTSDTFLQKC
ncbi:MAG: hypothetical protein RLZZ171_2590, partial [Cyanobacteriota bacterium]